jgi:hypothetical protein
MAPPPWGVGGRCYRGGGRFCWPRRCQRDAPEGWESSALKVTMVNITRPALLFLVRGTRVATEGPIWLNSTRGMGGRVHACRG